MKLSSDPTDPLITLRNRLREMPPRRRKCSLFVLIFVPVLLLTREAFFVPFVVGYTSARDLVEREDELARLKKQASECNQAAQFYGSPAGQEDAQGLALNLPKKGERRVILQEEPGPVKPSAVGHLRDWLTARERAGEEAFRYQVRIFKRWLRDPPKEPAEAPTPPGTGAQLPEARPSS